MSLPNRHVFCPVTLIPEGTSFSKAESALRAQNRLAQGACAYHGRQLHIAASLSSLVWHTQFALPTSTISPDRTGRAKAAGRGDLFHSGREDGLEVRTLFFPRHHGHLNIAEPGGLRAIGATALR